MLNKQKSQVWISTLILILAAALRLYGVSYGYDEACLTPEDEYWLYDDPQVSSLYSWDVRLVVEEVESDPRARAVAPTEGELLLMRLFGAVVGIFTVALSMRFARVIGANWWWIAGLFVALGPWFVNADRWVIRFDPAPLMVAISGLALLLLYQSRIGNRRFMAWIQVGAAVSLLLVAPPLWWMAFGLILLASTKTPSHEDEAGKADEVYLIPTTRSIWQITVFLILCGILLIPALQLPGHWLNAAFSWDMGAVAAVVWVLLALGLWRWRRLSLPVQAILTLAVLLMGAYSLLSVLQLPRLTAEEWQLVDFLQERIPDDLVVRFDESSWHLAPVVACPKRDNIQFTPQPLPVFMPFLPGTRLEPAPPDYFITMNRDELEGFPFVYELDSGHYVGRAAQLPNPVDVSFGGEFYVIGYELVTPTVRAGEVVDIRLDFQFSSATGSDSLAYAAFIHVTPPGQPGDQLVNFNVAFVEETPHVGPRRYALNRHFRFNLPADTLPGRYEILFGVYNMFSGERLNSTQGDVLLIGQVDVPAE